ncbi:unnamed protein product, partial [Allacma fusca]
MSTASANVVVSTSSLPVPSYDKKRMTSEHYLTQLEKFFEAQHHKQDKFLYLAGTVMTGETLKWYHNIVTRATGWDDLKKKFKEEFDTPFDQRERNKLLYTKTQRFDESVSSYVYEMVIRWDPDMADPTPGKLIAAAEDALRSLHKGQKFTNQGKIKLPPLHEMPDKDAKDDKGSKAADSQATSSQGNG